MAAFSNYSRPCLDLCPTQCRMSLQVRAQIRKTFTSMGFEEMPTNNYVESRYLSQHYCVVTSPFP